MNRIELKNINKSFNKQNIFTNFSLSINEGELVAIVGKSGSGKSTLLNIIGILDKVDSGEVFINSESYAKINSKAAELLRRNEIGYIFQDFALIEDETVEYNLNIARTYSEIALSNDDILKKFDLEGFEKKKIYELSGGEQQRVAIAMVFIKPYNILLADEPTGSLDKENSDIIMNYIKELNNSGKTILIVTHDDKIAKRCSRIIEL